MGEHQCLDKTWRVKGVKKINFGGIFESWWLNQRCNSHWEAVHNAALLGITQASCWFTSFWLHCFLCSIQTMGKGSALWHSRLLTFLLLSALSGFWVQLLSSNTTLNLTGRTIRSVLLHRSDKSHFGRCSRLRDWTLKENSLITDSIIQ